MDCIPKFLSFRRMQKKRYGQRDAQERQGSDHQGVGRKVFTSAFSEQREKCGAYPLASGVGGKKVGKHKAGLQPQGDVYMCSHVPVAHRWTLQDRSPLFWSHFGFNIKLSLLVKLF